MAESTPLQELTTQAGAVLTEEAGWLVPAHYGDATAEYRAAREACVLVDSSARGKVEVSGNEAPSFLHNLCSNDIAEMPLGAGCEAFFTTAKARLVLHGYI